MMPDQVFKKEKDGNDEEEQMESAVVEKPEGGFGGEEGEQKVTARQCGIAILIIVVAFILATILARSVGDFDTDESKTDPDEPQEEEDDGMVFNRIASLPICLQLDEFCNAPNSTNAEIIVATEDGNYLAYSDALFGAIGFINITDPANPVPTGFVLVDGEPTSLIITGNYVAAGVNTSPNFTNPSGVLKIIDIETGSLYHEMDLEGQPDSVALSPDKQFIAVAIENERDEDFEADIEGGLDGGLPQLPPGFLMVINSASADPKEWTSTKVDLAGLDGLVEPSDPEPEFVDINENNVCVVTLQENNAIVLVDLTVPEVIDSFSAGTVPLTEIDVEDDGIITVTGNLTHPPVPREPDGVTWIGNDYFATADEGDWNGGSRGFTIFNITGGVVFTSGNTMDWEGMRLGEYPESRSGKKGNEPENVRYAEYGNKKLLFVNSERSSLVFVYEVTNIEEPTLLQILPASDGPEGTVAIPQRDLFVAACEEDEREAKRRSHVVIYERHEQDIPDYPVIVSVDREDGTPRPFSALSALASSGDMLYTVEDSFFIKSRIFAINATTTPYTIVDDMRVVDSNDKLLEAMKTINETTALLNDDKTVNLDLEGIDVIEGGFWVCSEGSGTVGDVERPYMTPNLLARLNENAEIEEVVRLPEDVEAIQVRFGFEGVAVEGDNVVVTFQRAWQGETMARIGIYNTVSKSWKFVFYPLDTPISPYGGWVGLSDIESLGDGKFLILERDNQGGPDAGLKRIYLISLGDFSMTDGSMVPGKHYIRDLIPDMKVGGRPVFEKVEGLALDAAGNVWINTDNDGVDETSGENLLLNLGAIL